jgi:hypothetical protein
MAYKFQISANMLSWPRHCACCDGVPDMKIKALAKRTTGKRVRRTVNSWYEVPYCKKCLHHKSKFESASGWLISGFILGLVTWYEVTDLLNNEKIGFAAGISLFILSFIPYKKSEDKARLLMSKNCYSPNCTVRYLEWYGTFHTFVFDSEVYLNRFLAANSTKKRSDITEI